MENRILIVEDDLDIVDLLTIHMKDLNASVDSVNDGRSALEKALEIKYITENEIKTLKEWKKNPSEWNSNSN